MDAADYHAVVACERGVSAPGSGTKGVRLAQSELRTMMIDPEVSAALERDLTIDITTMGRRSGRPRRIEIWFHKVDGRFYITGIPGRRDWYANLLAHPKFMFHLKESVRADLPARARPVTDPEEKRRVLLHAETVWNRPDERNVDKWVRRSPLVEVLFEGA